MEENNQEQITVIKKSLLNHNYSLERDINYSYYKEIKKCIICCMKEDYDFILIHSKPKTRTHEFRADYKNNLEDKLPTKKEMDENYNLVEIKPDLKNFNLPNWIYNYSKGQKDKTIETLLLKDSKTNQFENLFLRFTE